MGDHLFNESEIQRPKHPKSLFDYACAFFRPVARALRSLQSRMTVELLCGEMSDVMERLRYDVLEQRQDLDTQSPSDATSMPVLYHRIHMSNIP